MSLVSKATCMLNRLYRGVLGRMRIMQYMRDAYNCKSRVSFQLEQLEPKQLMSADLALSHELYYTINEDTSMDFGAQTVVPAVTDTADDSYSLQLATFEGLLYNPQTSSSSTVITVTGTDLADINSALEDVIFTPTENYNGGASIYYLLQDDLQNSDSGTIPVIVESVNDAPVITAPANPSTNEDVDLVFTGANAISFTDVDDSGTDNEFEMVFVWPDAAGDISYTPIAGVTVMADIDGDNEDITFVGTMDDINSVLATLEFSPAANYNGDVDIWYQVADGGDNAPYTLAYSSDTMTVSVESVNDAPVITAPANPSTNEDVDLVFTGANAISFTDVDDSGTDNIFDMVFVWLDAAGDISYTPHTGVTVDADIDGTDEYVYFIGTMDDINSVLATLEFSPAANYNGDVDIWYQVADGGDNAPYTLLYSSDTMTVSVESVNDAPVVTIPFSMNTDEDTALSFSGINEISFTDVDSSAISVYDVTFLLENRDAGTFAYTPTTGVDFVMQQLNYAFKGVATGTLNALNSFLATLQFVPAENSTSGTSAYMTIDDYGDEGDSRASTLDQFYVTVNAVNDAPTIGTVFTDVAVNGSVTFSALATTDDVEGDIVTISSASSASNGSVTVHTNGTVTYTPDLDYSGYDSFTITVTDSNGGFSTGTININASQSITIAAGSTVEAAAIQGLSDLELIVCGTNNADEITVEQVDDGLLLDGNSSVYLFVGTFESVALYGFDGDDWLRAASGVSAEVYMAGGDDSDQLYHNGSGDAVLLGGAGDDILVSIGVSEDSLTGGSGFDSFWIDTDDTIADASTEEINALAVHEIAEFYQPYTDDNTDEDYVSMVIAGQDIGDPDTSYSYSNFADYPLFVGDPEAGDVNQGGIGDCYFVACLAGFAWNNPQVITQMVTALGDGTYAVRYYDNSQSEYYYLRVDADLPVLANGGLKYADFGLDSEIWVAIVEKAYAYCREGENSYASLHEGYTQIASRDISGYSYNYFSILSSTTATQVMTQAITALSSGYSVFANSLTSAPDVVGRHAYAILDAYYDEYDQGWIRIYNPHGVEFTLTVEMFMDNYRCLINSLA